MTGPTDTAFPANTTLTRRDWSWIGIAALAASAIRLLFATRRGFWLDEYYTLHAAQLPFGDLVADRLAAGHSPLVFLYSKLFLVLFGSSETALRASSAVAVGAAILGMAGCLGQLKLRRALVPALVLAVFSPYWQFIGTQFRYMMPLVAVSAFWMWAAAAWLERDTFLRWFALFVAGSLSLWLHGSAQFVLLALVVVFGWRAVQLRTRHHISRAQAARLFWPLLASFLVSVPLLIELGMMAKERSSSGAPNPFELLRNQASTYFASGEVAQSITGLTANAWQTIGLVFYLLGAYSAWRWLRRNPIEGAGGFLAAILVGLPLGMMVFSMTGDNVQGTLRYAAVNSVAITMLLGVGWVGSGIWKKNARWVWRGALCSFVAFMFLLQVLNQGDWHRESIKWLASVRQSDQPIVAIGKGMNLIAFEYHKLPMVGSISGVNSSADRRAQVREAFTSAWQNADSGFLFQYRGTDVPVNKVLDELEKAGFIVETRSWKPSRQMRIIAIARNPQGAATIKSLPDMPMPWITNEPLDRELWD